MSDRRARGVHLSRACLALMTLAHLASAMASAPAVGAFARLPPILDAQLSPDGTRAVMLRAVDETYHAVLADFSEGTIRPLMAADPEAFLFNWCRWANEERIVCSIRSYGIIRRNFETLRGPLPPRYWLNGHQGGADAPESNNRYQDGRTVFTRLLAIDADGSHELQLIPQPERPPGGGPLQWNDPVQDVVVSWLPGDADHILVQLRRKDPHAPTVFRLNIYDNRMIPLRRHHGAVQRWYADRGGELALADGYRGTEYHAFSVRDNRLHPLDLAVHSGLRAPVVAAIEPDGNAAYVVANNGRDTRGLYRLDTATGGVVETVHVDPDHDLDGADLVMEPASGKPLLLSFPRGQAGRRWFDEALGRQVGRLQRAMPGQPSSLRIISTDRRASRLIFATEGNGASPRLYLYDRSNPDDLILLGESYPDLEEVIEPEAVVYPARDGLRIRGLLTLPPDRPAGERLPTVILPQGGPWPDQILDRWAGDSRPAPSLPHGMPQLRAAHTMNAWSQFLVSRGYAVLQPFIRGAGGYGERYLSAGFEQWGLATQDDLMDGLDWLIERGITDPKRVCVAGGGYGGYAALVAAYRAPGRFRCAASFAGVSDLDAAARRWRAYPLGELAVARVQTGRARRESSPLHQVDRIALPLLIVHGDLDRSVVVDHSRRLVEALKEAGKPHRYIEQRGGDHFLSLQSHRVQLMEALESFLGAHLGPG